jgi:hypothetical protein
MCNGSCSGPAFETPSKLCRSEGVAASDALAEFRLRAPTRFVAEYMTKVDGATMHYGLRPGPILTSALGIRWRFPSPQAAGYRLKAVLREPRGAHCGAVSSGASEA